MLVGNAGVSREIAAILSAGAGGVKIIDGDGSGAAVAPGRAWKLGRSGVLPKLSLRRL